MLNPQNINVLRFFPGRGNRVWGARVLTSDAAWKYINVRRLFIFVEESIDEGTQWVVFEPNDEPLWARVRQTVTNFLTSVWRIGALQGATADEAFFVKCDRTTMTQDDIDNGRLICVIGIAPVKPAEFVIFRIQQKTLDRKQLARCLRAITREETMPPYYRDDPYAGYNFEVVVNGVSDDGTAVKGSFAEDQGSRSTIDPIEYRNGSEDITVRKIPGLKKFTNIMLKRGVTGDLAFWNWIVEGMNGPGAAHRRLDPPARREPSRKSCAGTSRAAGRASGPARASTRRTTRSRWRRSRSATKGSRSTDRPDDDLHLQFPGLYFTVVAAAGGALAAALGCGRFHRPHARRGTGGRACRCGSRAGAAICASSADSQAMP